MQKNKQNYNKNGYKSKKVESILDSMKKKSNLNTSSLSKNELVSITLMGAGIILTFFIPLLAGSLIGIAVGLLFSAEITRFLMTAAQYFLTARSIHKIMALGLLLYLLVTIPLFLVSLALGFGLSTYQRWR